MSLLARNTLFLTVAKFFSVAIYAVFGLALPRFFGDAHADEVGLYTLLSTFLFFGSMLTSFGIPLIVTREIARDHEAAPQLLARGRAGMILGYALSLTFLTGWILLEAWKQGHLASGAVFLETEGRTLVLFAVVMGIVLFDALGSLGDAVFQGFERMALPAAIEIVTGLVRAGGAFLALVFVPLESKLLAIYVCFLVGAAVRGLLLPRLVQSRLLHGASGGKVTLQEAWQTIVSSGFIALFRMLRMLRNRLDILLMGVLYVSLIEGVQADVEVARAIYGQALRVAIVFHTFTLAFNTALFPRLARLTGESGNRSGARALYSRAVRWQAFWAVPMAVGVFFYADIVAGWFGDKYAFGSPMDGVLHNTAEVLRVLLVAVLFDCLGGPVGFLMLGEKSMEKRIPMLGGLVAGTNLLLNLFLIPRHGILGAAYASAITAGVEFVVKLGIVGRLYGSPLPVLLRTLPHFLLAGLMFLGLHFLGGHEHWLLGSLLGATFYAIACLLTRQVDPAVAQLLRARLSRSG